MPRGVPSGRSYTSATYKGRPQPGFIVSAMKAISNLSVGQEIKLLGLVILFFSLLVYFLTGSLSLRLDTDYDAILPIYRYIVEYFRAHGSLPQVMPYAGRGLAIAGDPLSLTLQPIFLLPVLIFGVDAGIRVVFLFALLQAALLMWVFLYSLGITGLLRLWGALLYAFSGAAAAAVAAGPIGSVIFSS